MVFYSPLNVVDNSSHSSNNFADFGLNNMDSNNDEMIDRPVQTHEEVFPHDDQRHSAATSGDVELCFAIPHDPRDSIGINNDDAPVAALVVELVPSKQKTEEW